MQRDGDSYDSSDSDLRQGTETCSQGGVPTPNPLLPLAGDKMRQRSVYVALMNLAFINYK